MELTASTAAAKSLLYPDFFIIGMVKVPVVATFATAEPLIIPINAELMTLTFAEPPLVFPNREREIFAIKSVSPAYFKNDPKIINKNM